MTTAEEDLMQSIPIIYQAVLSLVIAMELSKILSDLAGYQLEIATKEKDSSLIAIKEALR